MNHYLAVRPYGDSLISLLLLHRMPSSSGPLEILGTPIVQEVARATGLTRFLVEPVLPDVAAFFDVRVKGARRALADLRRVRASLSRRLAPDAVLLVEQQDWRNRLLRPFGHAAPIEPERKVSVYVDRSALLERHFGVRLPLLPSKLPSARARSVLIHPGARQPARAFRPDVVENLLAYARARALSVCLIDPDGSYRPFAGRADDYLAAPRLNDAIAKLRATDLLIGADSFFLHLAYFYEIPLFGIGEVDRPYFSPPGMLEQHASTTLAAARDRATLSTALDRLLR